MDVFAETHAWAEHHVADAALGDQRRTHRLVQAAADIAAHPEESCTQVFDWNDLRGFYRLCDEEDVSHPAILQPHCQRKRQAIANGIFAEVPNGLTVPSFQYGFVCYHLSGERADQTFGLTHRPVEETVRDTLRWFGAAPL